MRSCCFIAAAAIFLGGLTSGHGAVVHQWLFNEASGNVLRDAKGTAHASIVRPAGGTAASLDGRRVHLPGGSRPAADYVSVPFTALKGLTDCSIELWAVPRPFSDETRLLDIGPAEGAPVTSNALRLAISRNFAGVDAQSAGIAGQPALNGRAPMPPGREYHFVLTWSADGILALYVDGVLADWQNTNGQGVSILASLAGGTFQLGRPPGDNQAGGIAFNELRIHDTVLDAATILQHARTGADNTWGLIHRWSMNEKGGSVIHDSVGTADGQIVASPGGPSRTLSGGALTLKSASFIGAADDGHADLGARTFDGLTDMTLEMWITTSPKPHFFDAVHCGTYETPDSFLAFTLYDDGGQQFQVLQAGQLDQGLYYQDIKPAIKHHYTIVWNAAAGHWGWFLDGVRVDSQPLGGLTLTQAASGMLSLAAMGAGVDPPVNTALAAYDEVRIWNRALSDGEIAFRIKAGPVDASVPALKLVDDAATLVIGGSVSLSVLANDPADRISTASVAISRQPAAGTAAVQPGGRILYHHTGDKAGADSLEYRAVDSVTGAVATATVRFTITDGGRIAATQVRLGGPSTPPPTLSATGLFADVATLTPNPGVNAYEVNLPAWTDGATARHWFAQPETRQTFGFSTAGNWFLPAGTVFVQHLELELPDFIHTTKRRIETRLLVKTPQGAYGLSYLWNDAQTEAVLAPEGGIRINLSYYDQEGAHLSRPWQVPSRNDCAQCHTAVGGHALGFRTTQLNKSAGPANQLALLRQLGFLDQLPPFPETLPALAPAVVDGAADTEHSRTQLVRSYLAANCVQCHQSGGNAPGSWDARPEFTLQSTRLINGLPYLRGTDPKNYLVRPGDPPHSVLLRRLAGDFSARPGLHMPGTLVADQGIIDLLTDWITLDLNGVGSPVSFYLQPGSKTVAEGGYAEFRAIIQGGTGYNKFTFQWLKGATVVGTQSLFSIPRASPSDEGIYHLVISLLKNDQLVGRIASDPFYLQVVPLKSAPRITSLTIPRTALIGQVLVFKAAAQAAPVISGPAAPAPTYQWRRNGRAVAGATGDTFATVASLAEAGLWSVAVTSGKETTVSDALSLTVIDSSPVRFARPVGGSVTFKAVTAGPVAGWQWMKAGADIPGATAATLTLTDLEIANDGAYACRVDGPAGTLTSGEQTLAVYFASPRIEDPVGMPPATFLAPYSFQIPVDGNPDRAPVFFRAAGLPAGLACNPLTGLISGSPRTPIAQIQSYTVTLTAGNSVGSHTVTTVLLVNPLPYDAVGRFVVPIGAVAPYSPIGGRLDYTISTSGIITGRLTLGTRSLPFTARAGFSISPYGDYYVTATARPANPGGLPVVLSFTPPIASVTIGGNTIASGGWRQQPPSAAIVGNYHFNVGPIPQVVGNAAFPQDPGPGTLKVAATGITTVAGRLGDGSAYTSSSILGSNSDWMAYAPLYGARGYVLTFGLITPGSLGAPPPRDDATLDAFIEWVRPAGITTTGPYKDGWTPGYFLINGARDKEGE